MRKFKALISFICFVVAVVSIGVLGPPVVYFPDAVSYFLAFWILAWIILSSLIKIDIITLGRASPLAEIFSFAMIIMLLAFLKVSDEDRVRTVIGWAQASGGKELLVYCSLILWAGEDLLDLLNQFFAVRIGQRVI